MSVEHLYHGSPIKDIDILEPRQAHNYNTTLGVLLPDGEPAVHAAKDIETAIFMALIGGNGWGGWNDKGFWVHERYLERITSPSHEGYIYVLPATAFERELDRRHPRAYEPVVPLGVLAVSGSDLPTPISIVGYKRSWPII